jgi:hypothetical protein
VRGTCGNHGLVGDGDSGIAGKYLAFLLFPCVDGKGEAQVNARMEVSHVVIQIRLADLGVGGEDVHNKGVEINVIETFGGVIKNAIVDIVDYLCELIVCDGKDHLGGVPCLMGSNIGGVQLFAFSCHGASWDNWLGWRFNMWDVEPLPFVCQVDSWILKKA